MEVGEKFETKREWDLVNKSNTVTQCQSNKTDERGKSIKQEEKNMIEKGRDS